MKHDDLFAELRSITQRAPSAKAWDALRALLDGMDERDQERFDTEIGPYLLGALSHWPDELRVVNDLADGVHLRSVSRTLMFDERDAPSRCTQSFITSQAEVWTSRWSEGIRRVAFLYVSSNLGRLYAAVLASLPQVHAVFVKGHFENRPDEKLAAQGVPVLSSDFVNLAVDLHGPSLESFGLQETWQDNGSKNNPTSRMWEALFARLDELPNLRALHVRQSQRAKRDLLAILSDPRLDHLEELQIVSYSKPLDISWLTERESSKNLRRVRIQPIKEAEALELVQAPNLSGVTCWELHEDYLTDTRTFGWGSERSRYLASKSPYLDATPGDLIATRWLDLFKLSKKAVHERLFDDAGNLRRSAHTQGIYLRFIRYRDLRTLFAQAHDAMPELRKLVFHGSFVLRPTDVRALSDSPLMGRLDTLWLRPGWSTHANTFGRGTAAELLEKRRAWFALAGDTSLHPALRLHAWRCGTEGGSTKDLRSTGRALEIAQSSRISLASLTRLIEARAPDVMDDPRVGILEGEVPPALDPGGAIAYARGEGPRTQS